MPRRRHPAPPLPSDADARAAPFLDAPRMHACLICANRDGNRELVAREMMFGTRDEFRYLECGACGCLQRLDPVAEPSRYYPPGYYAFTADSESRATRLLKQLRLRHVFSGRGWIGRALAWRFGVPPDLAAVRWAGVPRDASVLDVGCGDGRLLRDLRRVGFGRLTGIDPYLVADAEAAPGVPLLKRRLEDVTGSFDWVMLHHSFEHLPDPLGALGHVHRVLRPGGHVLLRIPLAGTYAYRTYGADWVQLDAPRHVFLHTRRSLRQLAEAASFEIESVRYDSTAFQFWGSEQYRRGLPLSGPGGRPDRPRPGLFSRRELHSFALRAEALNERADGDQACFVLRRA